MSLPVRDVCLEEGSILSLIRDYFEESGLAECLQPLEHLCHGSPADPFQHNHTLPLEVAALRELVLAGKWDHVMKYLDRFGGEEEKEGLKKCRYLAHKQKYLEILHHVETDIESKLRLGFGYYETGGLLSPGEVEKVRQVMEAELTALEPLCSSCEDYQSLRTLLSMPSISSSREYSTWQVQSGRLEVFYEIQDWVSKALYLNVWLPAQQAGRSSSSSGEASQSCALLRLLAKGLLYEQSERLCRARCGEKETSDHTSNMLDLRGWLQQQPDSSFQLQPSELCLVVSPWRKSSTLCLQTSVSVDIGAISRGGKVSLQQNVAAAKSVSTFHLLHETQHAPPSDGRDENTITDSDSQNTQQKQESSLHYHPGEPSVLSHPSKEDSVKHPAKETNIRQTAREASVGHVKRESETFTEQQPTVSTPLPTGPNLQPSQSKNAIIPSKPSVQEVETTGHPQEPKIHDPCNKSEPDGPNPDPVCMANASGGEGTVFLPSTTPLSKATRFSSTPKDVKASRTSLKTSPPSSPIASSPNLVTPVHTPANAAPPGRSNVHVAGEGGQRAKKHIDFDGHQRTQRWPTVSLLSSITDTQAVRSVAFSQSGKLVAVGANSGTLRLCSVPSLVENKPSDELSVLYEHPRYHRGSIYCLAWFRDTLLASGSNDKTISLLTNLPSSFEPKYKVQKPFPLHRGTIRDMLFTPDGLLVYGGGVSTEVQVTNIQTCQSVVSLAGHTDQVLALGVLPGGLLASSGQDKTVLLWDMRSRLPVSTLNLDMAVASLTSSGSELVTSHLDGSCAVHDLNTFKCLSTYKAHSKECRSVRYYPKSKEKQSWVLTGSYDKTVCLMDADSLQWTKLCQHDDKVIQCRWHPCGNIFASTGADKRACFWSIS